MAIPLLAGSKSLMFDWCVVEESELGGDGEWLSFLASAQVTSQYNVCS